MKILYEDDKYIVNYDELSLIVKRSHKCLIKYLKLTHNIHLGMCGDSILELKLINPATNGFDYRKLKAYANNHSMANYDTLHKLADIAKQCYEKEFVREEAKEKDDKFDWFCPCCGNKLDRVPEDNDHWFDFCSVSEENNGTEYYLCSNTDCVYNDCPLLLFNSALGWQRPAGDNWAIGYIK